jgi:hypothetical protein
MPGYVRRFTEVPTLEVIREIEGLVIVDLAPPAPATGAGSGTVLLVGEFEDGYFATDEEALGAVEVYGSGDYQHKFGGFGYLYNGVKANHPSARRSLSEDWNGNGWLKSYGLKANRLLVSRVDTSVGEVVFSPLATIKGSAGPWPLDIGDVLSATTNTGTGTTTALAATAATVTGSGAALGTIVGGDTFTLQVDHGPVTTITFGAADITIAAVVARINNTLGAIVAANSAGQLALTGIRLGTAGQLVLADVTAGCLAKLGHTAATTDGTGNVANLASVTATEVAALVNASASMGAANAAAKVSPSDGKLWLYHTVSATASTIQIDAGTGGMGAALGFVIDVDAAIALNEAGTIPAGTRVQASSLSTFDYTFDNTFGGSVVPEWVTMQTIDIPAGAAGPFTVRVRPGRDNGTSIGAAISLVNTLVDSPSFAAFTVSNPAALTAALTEGQKDAAYKEALDATLNELGVCREANYLLIARCSDSVKREGRANAVLATEIGMFGRKYIAGNMLGTSPDASIVDVASYRRDRLFYSALALKVKIPVIAERGTGGGSGFTADGIINVRPDGPLCTLCARLPPEENPGQQTNLIDDFFAVNAYGASITIDTYKAFRRNGICAPRVDRVGGTIFQSGVTSSLISGEETIARRRMADFIQDSAIGIWLPYSKKIAREAVRMRALAKWNQFLAGLESAANPEKSRIHSWSTDDGVNAGNTNTTLALGVYYVLTKVKTHPSLDFIVLQTEIGENAIITKSL